MSETETTISVEDDWDSAYEEGDTESDTASLRSAVTNYIYENGRRYNSFRSGSYWGSNDDEAMDAIDLLHHVYRLTFDGKLFLAPIGDNPLEVLDLGTGTGLWAMEIADEFPSAFVIGTDLSPIQPTWVPPNLQFEVHDFCGSWSFKKNRFDYIHARGILGCVADYGDFYAKVLDHLKPGGWYEQAETSVEPLSHDGSTKGTPLERWGLLNLEASEKFGKTFRIAYETEERMKAAGFVNVKYQKRVCPLGPWTKDKKLKEIGIYNRMAWEEGMEGWVMYLFTRYLGWKTKEVQEFCAETRRTLRDNTVHAFQELQENSRDPLIAMSANST